MNEVQDNPTIAICPALKDHIKFNNYDDYVKAARRAVKDVDEDGRMVMDKEVWFKTINYLNILYAVTEDKPSKEIRKIFAEYLGKYFTKQFKGMAKWQIQAIWLTL